MFAYFQKLQNCLWKWFYILVIYEQAKNNIKFTVTKIDCFLTFFCQKLYPEFAKY